MAFWSATLLPSISKDKVTKQRAENNKLIKEEKRYQNAIAKIRKKATDMSYAEAKKRNVKSNVKNIKKNFKKLMRIIKIRLMTL